MSSRLQSESFPDAEVLPVQRIPSKFRPVIALYERWHQKKPDTVMRVYRDIPEKVRVHGFVSRIDYLSDKWEGDGEAFHYEHDADSAPTLYTLFGEGPEKSTTSLLKMECTEGEFPLVYMGNMLEMEFVPVGNGRVNGRKNGRSLFQTMVFSSRATALCHTPDDRGLLIFSPQGLMVVRGGTMHVTERGIVD